MAWDEVNQKLQLLKEDFLIWWAFYKHLVSCELPDNNSQWLPTRDCCLPATFLLLMSYFTAFSRIAKDKKILRRRKRKMIWNKFAFFVLIFPIKFLLVKLRSRDLHFKFPHSQSWQLFIESSNTPRKSWGHMAGDVSFAEEEFWLVDEFSMFQLQESNADFCARLRTPKSVSLHPFHSCV